MTFKTLGFSLLISALPMSLVHADPVGKSDLTVTGVKHPNSADEGTDSVTTLAEVSVQPLQGFNEMLPYVLRSPDQEDAGSCHYMALTGIAEWWLAKLNPTVSRASDGPLDLSERYLMNLAGLDEASNGVENWKTDSIELYNDAGKGVLNTSYRYTKGWYSTDDKGDYKAAVANAPGAEYGTPFNWLNKLDSVTKGFVTLPSFERKVIFADPESNQWNVAVTPANIVEQVKTALKTQKAPINVVYNHYGYWHSVYVVGYDDDADTKACKFVEGFSTYMQEQPDKLRQEAAKATTAEERTKLLKRADKFEKISVKFENRYRQAGGCHSKGVFYVRDSIYGVEGEPAYDYDLSQTGDEGQYSKAIVLREYDWLETMANHVTQISVK